MFCFFCNVLSSLWNNFVREFFIRFGAFFAHYLTLKRKKIRKTTEYNSKASFRTFGLVSRLKMSKSFVIIKKRNKTFLKDPLIRGIDITLFCTF